MSEVTLSYPLDTEIEAFGTVYGLKLSFDTVLRFYDLRREDLFSGIEQLDIALNMFIGDGKALRRLTPTQKLELMTAIYQNFIKRKERPTRHADQKLVDYKQDAGFIYAAFLQTYQIDLMEEQGSLDWRVFIALLESLPKDTKIKEIMGIRGRPIPEPTKHNQPEIQDLQDAKAYYALEFSAEQAQTQFQQGLDRLGRTLEGLAKSRV